MAPAPAGAQPTVEDLRRLLREGDAPLVDLAAEDGGTLPDASPAPLLDRLGADLPCGTLAARLAAELLEGDAVSETRRRDLERLLEPPTLAAVSRREAGGASLEWDSSVTSRHALGSRDGDRNGLPDLVDATLADLTHAMERIQSRLDWDGPSPAAPLPVVLASSGWRDGMLAGGARPHVVLPRSLGGEERLRTIAHQLAHAALEEIAPNAPAGWEEAAATFLAEEVVANAADRALDPKLLLSAALRDEGRRHARQAIGSPGLTACRGDAAFFAWMEGALELDASWLPRTWAELAEQLERESRAEPVSGARSEQLALEALDAVLARSGSDLASAVSAYQAWSLIEDIQAGPQVPVDAELSGHPSGDARGGLELPPFAQLRYSIEVPADGGLRVDFESDPRTEAELFLVLGDDSIERFRLGSDIWGEQSLRIPGGRVRALFVLVSTPVVPTDLSPWRGEGGSASGEFRIRVEQDASYPFVLAEVAVEARVDQVRIDWMTSSEEDLVAWHVERSRRLAGPWRRVTAAPMPPSSLPDTFWSYSLVDQDVRPSTRYHYRLVGVTSSGLVERSATASVLTLPDGPDGERRSSRR